MRAAVITEPGGPDVLKVMEVDDPIPGSEDILVDVKATALYRADTMPVSYTHLTLPTILLV